MIVWNVICKVSFNSHAHMERDFLQEYCHWIAADNFDSHAHVERDLSGIEIEY